MRTLSRLIIAIILLSALPVAAQRLQSEVPHDTAIPPASMMVVTGCEAKDQDGAALPRAVSAEGDAVRCAMSLSGVLYVMPVNEDGSANASVNVGTFPDNEPFNVAQFGGSAVVTGTGASGAGIPRVTLSNDSTLAANQSVNVAQVNGVATSTGVGASGTGTQRVVAASTDPCQSSGVSKTSLVVNVTTSAQVIGAVGGQIAYVCGFSLSIAGTTPTMQFQYGTGSVCATGLANLTGVYAPLTGSMITFGSGSATVLLPPVSQAVCIATTGTSPSVQGVLTYIQQ